MPEPVSDDKFRKAMDAAVREHMDRRANAAEDMEVKRFGWFRWKYRFYWGRHVVHGGISAWTDYETGTRITRQGALFAAARQLTKLQIKHSQTWEPE